MFFVLYLVVTTHIFGANDMDSLLLGTIESEELEDTGLSIATSAEEVDEYEDDDSTVKPDAVDAAQKPHSCNVVYAYLNEVKNWPILSRDQEYVLAKAYHEAESRKSFSSAAMGEDICRLY